MTSAPRVAGRTPGVSGVHSEHTVCVVSNEGSCQRQGLRLPSELGMHVARDSGEDRLHLHGPHSFQNHLASSQLTACPQREGLGCPHHDHREVTLLSSETRWKTNYIADCCCVVTGRVGPFLKRCYLFWSLANSSPCLPSSTWIMVPPLEASHVKGNKTSGV